jgi:hypothetical protein
MVAGRHRTPRKDVRQDTPQGYGSRQQGVTANAGYFVTGGSAFTLLISGANQRSPAPNCLSRFYRD